MYTKLPNRLIRSKKLNAYDKVIYACIASCNPSFPSYKKLSEWSGLSRERVWKSINRLIELGVIQRVQHNPRRVEYKILIDDDARLKNSTSSSDEPLCTQPSSSGEPCSSSGELPLVRETNSKKNNRKRTNKKGDASHQVSFASLVQKAREYSRREIGIDRDNES